MAGKKLLGFDIVQLLTLGGVVGTVFGIAMWFGNKWVDSTENHVKDVGQRVEKVDERVEHLAAKVSQVDREVGEVKQGLVSLDKRADNVDKRLDTNSQQGAAILEELKSLRQDLKKTPGQK